MRGFFCSSSEFDFVCFLRRFFRRQGFKGFVSTPLLCVGAVLFVAGCAGDAGVNPSAPPVFTASGSRIALMPVDVQLFELTASGLEQPRADWTQAASQYVDTALRTENEARHLQLIDFQGEDLPPEVRAEIHQIIKLHEAVGAAMLMHRHVPHLRLPTKTSVHDWTLGQEVSLLKTHTSAEYALFVFMKDSYQTAGRIAVNILITLLGGYAQGGTQVGYATLVNLDDGSVAWFNSLARGTGDLRTPDAAAEAVRDLLKGLPGA